MFLSRGVDGTISILNLYPKAGGGVLFFPPFFFLPRSLLVCGGWCSGVVVYMGALFGFNCFN